MKVLICGEGPHDIGLADEWCSRTKSYLSVDGWLQPLVRRIRTGEIELSIKRRQDLTILPKEMARFKPFPSGHGAKALLAKRAAVLGKFDAVIFMVDTDSADEKKWREILSDITEGFSRIDSEILSVACIPMAASESWLLSDGAAWASIAGCNADGLPAQPETAWGARNDPEADHPHRLFARVCKSVGREDGRSIRSDLANCMDLELVAQKCPVSFQSFWTALAAA